MIYSKETSQYNLHLLFPVLDQDQESAYNLQLTLTPHAGLDRHLDGTIRRIQDPDHRTTFWRAKGVGNQFR